MGERNQSKVSLNAGAVKKNNGAGEPDIVHFVVEFGSTSSPRAGGDQIWRRKCRATWQRKCNKKRRMRVIRSQHRFRPHPNQQTTPALSSYPPSSSALPKQRFPVSRRLHFRLGILTALDEFADPESNQTNGDDENDAKDDNDTSVSSSPVAALRNLVHNDARVGNGLDGGHCVGERGEKSLCRLRQKRR